MKKILFSIILINLGYSASIPKYTCGIFDSGLIAEYVLTINNVHVCNSLSIMGKNININNSYCSPNQCGNEKCIKELPKTHNYSPFFIESKKLNRAKTNLFDKSDYKDTVIDENADFVFAASEKYTDSDVKYSTYGTFTFNKGGKFIFKKGDYYFDNLVINSDAEIEVEEGTRIFVKGNFIINNGKATFNNAPQNLFVYVGGDLNLNLKSGSIVKGFFYVKNNINVNNGDIDFYGAVHAEGNINMNNTNFYYIEPDNTLGYKNCSLCYVLQNKGVFVDFNHFINGNFYFPREVAIINFTNNTLEDLNVIQIEENPSWINIGTPESYAIRDKNGFLVYNDIENLTEYVINVLGKEKYLSLISKGKGKVYRLLPTIQMFNSIKVKTIETTAYFGDYSYTGYNDYYILETYGIKGNFLGHDNFYYKAEYTEDNKPYYSNIDYCSIQRGNYPKDTGPIDAWDVFRNVNDKRISTKIVNKPFQLTIAGLDDSYKRLKRRRAGKIEAVIYDMDRQKIISDGVYFDSNKEAETAAFNVKEASKNARVAFILCSNYSKKLNKHEIHHYDKCGGFHYHFHYDKNDHGKGFYYGENNIKIEKCDTEGFHLRVCFSSDNFAVRPDKFVIKKEKEDIKSGEDFIITFKALDYLKKETVNYNEKIYTDENLSVKLDYTQKKGCDKSNLLIKEGERFENGKTEAVLQYDNVGKLKLTLHEIEGSEFALVDKDDTPTAQRLITSASTNITFIPYKFGLETNITNSKGFDYTFLSNNLNEMATDFNLKIKSLNKQDKVTDNFDRNCYANPVDVQINYSLDDKMAEKVQNLKYLCKDKETKEKSKMPVLFEVSKQDFNKGIAEINLKLNFEKNYRQTVEPFKVKITSIDTQSKDKKVESSVDINKDLEFRYGKLIYRNYTKYSNKIDFQVGYAYWDNKYGWLIEKKYNPNILGDINLSKSIIDKDVKITKKETKDEIETFTASTIHSLPYSTKIHLAIPSFLWYHPLAKDYKDPSKNNLDCLTHPCIVLTFLKHSVGWGGVGVDNNTTNAEARAVKFNKIDNLKEYFKISW